MATAARVTVAEVERLVEPARSIPPHPYPGIFVKRIVSRRKTSRSASSKRTVRKRS